MDYKILKVVSLEGVDSTGKTKHLIGNEMMPKPVALQIVKYDGDTGYYLFYMSADGKEMTDTYHETMEMALLQAEWEFNIVPVQWDTVLD